jgi:hypothetical protein
MSISAMLSSCPSYYLGSNFVDMRLQNSGQPNAGSILKPLGYKTHCITLGPHERGAWDGILDVVPRRLWPADATHRFEWTNDIINRTLEPLVKEGLSDPFFFLLHYNCRGDQRISENVGKGLELLESSGALENSVVLLTSDHGYPDPLRRDEVAKRRAHAALKHRDVAHDLVLTDDNVLVPLLLKYPGFKPQRIEQQVCTLDYLPTSLELAGVTDVPELYGKSFVPLLSGESMPEIENRKVRIDGRFLAQTGRCTAIRTNSRKYICYPDESEGNHEQFYDLTSDELEINNLINDEAHQDEIAEFREHFLADEERSKQIQAGFMRELYVQELKAMKLDSDEELKSVLFVRSGRERFDEVFENVLLDVYGSHTLQSTGEVNKDIRETAFDLAIAGVSQWGAGQSMCRTLNPVRAGKKILVNMNTNVMPHSSSYLLTAFKKDWRVNKKYYLAEPLYWVHSMLHRK